MQAITFQNSARGTRNLAIGIWNPVPAIRNPQRGIYNPGMVFQLFVQRSRALFLEKEGT